MPPDPSPSTPSTASPAPSPPSAAPAPAHPLALEPALAEIAAEVESALDALLPSESEEPRELARAMRYGALGGGKRVRPALVLLSADLHGAARAEALPVACAYECVHVYSLIHDDLPAMDDDDLRRGKPTSHKVFGEAMAILAGDALLTFAFELAARPERNAAALVRDLSRVAGPHGMVGGQVLDIRGEGKSPERPSRDAATLERIHRWKTAALILGAARAGALLAGADPGPITTYGSALGLAFQVVDDILDVEATTEALGKTAGKDAAAGKMTYPSIHGMDAAKLEARRLVDDAVRALDGIEPAGEPGRRARALLRDLAHFVRDRKK
jgi:geranylgeranyl diphosphate synthase type II